MDFEKVSVRKLFAANVTRVRSLLMKSDDMRPLLVPRVALLTADLTGEGGLPVDRAQVFSDNVRGTELLEALPALELRLPVVVKVVFEGAILRENILALRACERFTLDFVVISFVNLQVVNVGKCFTTGLAHVGFFRVRHVVDLIVSL